MSKRLSLEEIRAFWAKRATRHLQSPAASWSDQMAIELEIREIAQRLEDGDRVLDLGCANGYSTLRFAIQKRIEIRGVDVVSEMIEQARKRLAQVPEDLRGRIQFRLGDALTLQEPTGAYDKVVATRVIINLGEWELQLRAIKECTRVLKPGGMFLLSEATLQGWQQLNKFRREWGLPSIPMPAFNLYLDQDRVVEALSPDLQLLELVNFSSTYYVGTRVLKPLLIQALGAKIDVADPNMEWNRWFTQLPSWGEYGTQKLFAFRKK